MSNGTTIKEPNPGCAVEGIRDCRFPMSADVTGKGKGKMDDMPASTGSGNVYFLFVLYYMCVLLMLIMFVLRLSLAGYHRVDGCVPRNSLADQSSGNVARFALRRLLTFLQTANIGNNQK